MTKEENSKVRVYLGKEANEFLRRFNLNIAEYDTVKDFTEAEKKLNGFKFPLVLKLISEDVIHKTEIGGVKIVNRKEEFESAFSNMLESAKKKKIKVDNFLLQEYVDGVELVVGLKKDATFEHVVMLGLGGIYVEALHDVTFRVCPINEEEAEKMIHDLKASKVILSERKKLNIEELLKVLVKVSKIPTEKKNLFELDINPLMLNSQEAKVVDARVVLE